MPELPEVETIVRGLRRRIIGRTISSCRVIETRILRKTGIHNLEKLTGCKVTAVERRGKLILVHLSGGLSLVFHLKMTGQMLLALPQEPRDKHTHFLINFRMMDAELRFRDVRKFGFICCLETSKIFTEEPLKNLGPEPLDLEYGAFSELFVGRKGRLKSLLLNQAFLAGIGNIYADEILFQAGLNPLSPGSSLSEKEIFRLWQAMRTVLHEAIKKKGSSLRDYRDAEGRKGNFQHLHKVYGRESLPCPGCGTHIQRIRIGGRSSFFCPQCQRRISRSSS
ncbi:MAG: bifunctional DNA-formamidopyrimidine glycosylase/DNA-(apurinic or apyrimidinic site) lyase [Candidatus Aminicenantes bacterium]|nr:bifunctional DNA-formamidopyrimidine glycosylase/DNA-(apurinic or apyrimidinic site) lyase [Candidatus Aminicenantes bacterium]